MAMRFSRERKQEVHFRRSLFRFCSLFIFILGAGLLTRYYLSHIPLEEKLRDTIKISDHFQVLIQNPEIAFSQGFMPILGLKIARIEAHEKSCIAKRIVLQDSTFVINPWQLLKGRFKLGWLKIGHLELDFPSCHGELTPDSPLKNNLNPISSEDRLSLKNITRKSLKDEKLVSLFKRAEVALNANKVSYVFVDSFSVRFLKSLEKLILVKGSLSASIHQHLKTDINITDFSIDDHELPLNSAHVRLEVNPSNIKVEMKTLVREGQVVFKIEIDNQQSFPTKTEFKIDKLPVSTITQFFSKEILLSYLWFNCRGSSQSYWKSFLETDLEIKSCGFDGPYGDISLNRIRSSFVEIKTVEAEVKKMDLDKILKSKRNVYLSGVFAHYGVLSSKLVFENNQLEVDGLLEKAGLIFSRNNFRDIQKVLKIPFKFKGHTKDWQAELKGIEIEEGWVDGDIQIQLNKNSENPHGKVSFHKLVLNPKIYKLMLSSKPAELALYGKFKIVKNKLREWSALLATSLLESDSYQLKNLKISAQSSDDGSSEVKVTAGRGFFNKDLFLSYWLNPTSLDDVWNDERKELKELSLKFYLSENQKLEWKRVYLLFSNGWQLSSEGVRDEGKRIKAWLQWDKKETSITKWSFFGLEGKGEWQPESESVKKWLDIHPEYLKKYKLINYEIPASKSLGSKINEVGEEAIKKVKNVLGPKKVIETDEKSN